MSNRSGDRTARALEDCALETLMDIARTGNDESIRLLAAKELLHHTRTIQKRRESKKPE